MQPQNFDRNIDEMTGLFTGAHGMNILRHLIDEMNALQAKKLLITSSEASSSEASIGIIFADIYKLKLPHDEYGHPPIDEVICTVGNVIQDLMREGDIVCRYGGDEFLIIMPGVSEKETRQWAEQLRQAAAQVRVMFNGQPREHIILSIGVAHYPTIYQKGFISRLRGVEGLMWAADEDLERDRSRNAGA